MTEEKGSLQLKSIGEILNGDFGDIPESTYRRGYTQGYFAALEDMKTGANLNRLYEFQYNELYVKWRMADKGERTYPPEYQRQRRENDKPI